MKRIFSEIFQSINRSNPPKYLKGMDPISKETYVRGKKKKGSKSLRAFSLFLSLFTLGWGFLFGGLMVKPLGGEAPYPTTENETDYSMWIEEEQDKEASLDEWSEEEASLDEWSEEGEVNEYSLENWIEEGEDELVGLGEWEEIGGDGAFYLSDEVKIPEVIQKKISFEDGYPIISSVSKDRFVVKMKANGNAIVYFGVFPIGVTTPQAISIAEGFPDETPIVKGSANLEKDKEARFTVSNLSMETSYMIYLVLENEDEILQESVLGIEVRTRKDYRYTGPAYGGEYEVDIEFLQEVDNIDIFGLDAETGQEQNIMKFVNVGGDVLNVNPKWLKFEYKVIGKDASSKTLYLPKSSISSRISWEDIHKAGAVFGKEIQIGEQKYKVRLIKGGTSQEGSSEWNDLYYGIHEMNYYDWGVNYTNEDLEIGRGQGKAIWTQDEIITKRKVIRGFIDVNTFGTNSSFNVLKDYGWRPILEEIP